MRSMNVCVCVCVCPEGTRLRIGVCAAPVLTWLNIASSSASTALNHLLLHPFLTDRYPLHSTSKKERKKERKRGTDEQKGQGPHRESHTERQRKRDSDRVWGEEGQGEKQITVLQFKRERSVWNEPLWYDVMTVLAFAHQISPAATSHRHSLDWA